MAIENEETTPPTTTIITTCESHDFIINSPEFQELKQNYERLCQWLTSIEERLENLQNRCSCTNQDQVEASE